LRYAGFPVEVVPEDRESLTLEQADNSLSTTLRRMCAGRTTTTRYVRVGFFYFGVPVDSILGFYWVGWQPSRNLSISIYSS